MPGLAMRLAPVCLLVLVAAAALAPQAQTARGRLVAEVGGSVALPGGGTAPVLSLGLPTVTGEGAVAFTGSLLAAGDTVGFVFAGDAVRWRNTDAVVPLAGREAWMGAAADGAFVYSPTVDGVDGLWTDRGLLVRRGDPAPDAPDQFVAFASRPGMTAGGAAHWIGGRAATPDGPATARAVYVSPDRWPGSTSVVLAEGDPVGGTAVTAIDFNYSIADDTGWALLVSRTNGRAVVVSGTVVAQENQPLPSETELWQSFSLVRVSPGGAFLIAGNTNAPTAADEVVALTGAIVLREGQAVGGVTLGAEVRGVAIEYGSLVGLVAWTTAAGPDDEVLVGGQMLSDFADTATVLLRTGQGLDTSGDGVPDYTVADFEFSAADGPDAITLGGGRTVYLRLGLVPAGGGPPRDAIVGIDYAAAVVAAEPGHGETAPPTLTAWPNPSRGPVALTLTTARPGAVRVEVLDVLGRRVARLHDGPLAAGPAHLSLDATPLPAGLYVVRATGDGWSVTRRVVRDR